MTSRPSWPRVQSPIAHRSSSSRRGPVVLLKHPPQTPARHKCHDVSVSHPRMTTAAVRCLFLRREQLGRQHEDTWNHTRGPNAAATRSRTRSCSSHQSQRVLFRLQRTPRPDLIKCDILRRGRRFAACGNGATRRRVASRSKGDQHCSRRRRM